MAEVYNCRVATAQSLVMDLHTEKLFRASYHNDELLRQTILPVAADVVPDRDSERVKYYARFNRPERLTAGILIASPHPKNYYHWMFETLPRLWALQEAAPSGMSIDKLPVIVPRLTERFQVETLAALGIGNIYEYGGTALDVWRLIFPSFYSPDTVVSPALVTWLRSMFLGEHVRRDPKKKLYLARGKVSTRQVIGEEHLSQYFAGLGFTVVDPGTLPHYAQVELLSDAAAIVGFHGSALTNMVFAPFGCKVLELFPNNFINRCYFYLANACGHQYSFLPATPAFGSDLSAMIRNLELV